MFVLLYIFHGLVSSFITIIVLFLFYFSLSRNLDLNGRSFLELRKNEKQINYFEWEQVTEKRKVANKICPVDLAGHFGTPYVPSPRREPRQCRRQSPYEAGEIINIDQSEWIFLLLLSNLLVILRNIPGNKLRGRDSDPPERPVVKLFRGDRQHWWDRGRDFDPPVCLAYELSPLRDYDPRRGVLK